MGPVDCIHGPFVKTFDAEGYAENCHNQNEEPLRLVKVTPIKSF
jgi:hypothetical protein